MKKSNRFVLSESSGLGFATNVSIIVDLQTGVNYIFAVGGYAGGLTPLLDAEGKPIVTKPPVSSPV